jgi:acetate kinase
MPCPRAPREGVRRYGFHGLSYEYIADRLPRGRARDRQGPRHRRASRQRRLDVRARRRAAASRARWASPRSTGCRWARGRASSTRGRALPDEREGHERGRSRTCSTRKSGLKGLSGVSNDMRDLLDSEDPCAPSRSTTSSIARAFGGRARRGAGRLDGFVFTAGVGENAARDPRPHRRAPRLARRELDPDANAAGGRASRAPAAASPAYVIPTDEELMIARHTLLRCDRRRGKPGMPTGDPMIACPPWPAARGQEGAGRRHRQRPLHRLGLRRPSARSAPSSP